MRGARDKTLASRQMEKRGKKTAEDAKWMAALARRGAYRRASRFSGARRRLAITHRLSGLIRTAAPAVLLPASRGGLLSRRASSDGYRIWRIKAGLFSRHSATTSRQRRSEAAFEAHGALRAGATHSTLRTTARSACTARAQARAEGAGALSCWRRNLGQPATLRRHHLTTLNVLRTVYLISRDSR